MMNPLLSAALKTPGKVAHGAARLGSGAVQTMGKPFGSRASAPGGRAANENRPVKGKAFMLNAAFARRRRTEGDAPISSSDGKSRRRSSLVVASNLNHYASTAQRWGKRGKSMTESRRSKYGNSAISLGKCQPVESLWDVDWSEALNFKRSDGGRSSGVYFVQMPPGDSLVVVKPDDCAIPDYMGYLIGRYFRVASPEMRAVLTASDEGQAIVSRLEALDLLKPKSDRCDPPIRKALTHTPCLLIMNFVKGVSLKQIALQGAFGMTVERDAQLIRTFGPLEGELSEGGRETLRQMGRMMAFDVLIYNYDRLPCGKVFQNAGNTENAMLSSSGHVIAIDSMVSAFDISQPKPKEQFDAFLSRVDRLLTELVQAPDEPHQAFRSLRELLLHGIGDESDEAYTPGTAYDIGEAGVRELQAGFVSTFPDFLKLPESCLHDVPRMLTAYMGEGNGEEQCNAEFLIAIAELFRRAARTSGARQPTAAVEPDRPARVGALPSPSNTNPSDCESLRDACYAAFGMAVPEEEKSKPSNVGGEEGEKKKKVDLADVAVRVEARGGRTGGAKKHSSGGCCGCGGSSTDVVEAGQ